MSGVYIPGMKMPGNRAVFIAIDNGDVFIKPLGSLHWTQLDEKAVEILDHGRLVDGDKIVEGCKDEDGRYISQFAAVVGETVEAAPTVIPADKEAET